MFGIAEERKIDTWAELDRRFTEEQAKTLLAPKNERKKFPAKGDEPHRLLHADP